ncbi:MAG: bifunctional phosphoribosylaminoimidazolecarboxamide formyltransferase/IMP cyclohydrolase [Deltaproteobacteria bacterium]|nr:bifunctional phosphoribosylaminoimidazolecarboxamide formyltransferase/IMP cyclohydrolase [Deltaproteobacteria bacterium]
MTHSTYSKRALLSVSNKEGIAELGKALAAAGFGLLSTGGTAKVLREAGLEVEDVADYTGHPEILDGRVKTLHPKVHGGLLARREENHLAQLTEHQIDLIDVVVVNLYPFAEAAKKDADWDTLIENVDIGGPSMLRSAAKNHQWVTVLCDPADYENIVSHLAEESSTSSESRSSEDRLQERRRLALKAFAHTAAYDARISFELRKRVSSLKNESAVRLQSPPLSDDPANELRYGENPHQVACVKAHDDDEISLAGTQPLQGKALSYNNLLDADAALFALRCLVDGQTEVGKGCVVIKHGTPCGAAQHEHTATAFARARSGDPVSAFGGIVALGGELDEETAAAMSDLFLEVIVASGFSDAARALLAKKKNLRLLQIPNLVNGNLPSVQSRSISGGTLLQAHDLPFLKMCEAKVATKRAPTDDEKRALDIAFRMGVSVRSNAITLASASQLLSSGGGQTSRVDAVHLAVKKAREHDHNVQGAALGSDAFFPFADGVLAAIEAGVTCIAQPGGSKRDDEVIAACDEHNVAMVFTGERHFRH